MKRNSIIIEELERRIRFYQGMGTSSNTADPFDFKNLEIALAEIKNICFRSCDFSNTLFKNVSLSNVTFINCNLTNTRFIDSELSDIKIINSPIVDARFKDSDIDSIPTLTPFRFRVPRFRGHASTTAKSTLFVLPAQFNGQNFRWITAMSESPN